MKRFAIFSGTFTLCMLLVGCSSDSYVGLVKDTILMIQSATTEVGNIKSRVSEAIKATEDNKKLDLSAAIEATKKLKDVGVDAQKLKQRIEFVRKQVADDDKKAYAKSEQQALNAAFGDLLKKKEELRVVLAEAEKLGATAKIAVKDFREKLTEAEAPFEALSR